MTDCFISPEGNIIPVSGYGGHIETVWDNPEEFGYTKQQIRKTYADYLENINDDVDADFLSDGYNARDKILIDLAKVGWIKVSAYTSFLGVAVWEFNSNSINNLRNFARQVLGGKFGKEVVEQNISVYVYADGSLHESSVRDLSRGIISFNKYKFKKLSLRKQLS